MAVSSGDTPSAVNRTSYTTHGWRPISAVHQPAMIATSTKNTVITSSHRIQRASQIRRGRSGSPFCPRLRR